MTREDAELLMHVGYRLADRMWGVGGIRAWSWAPAALLHLSGNQDARDAAIMLLREMHRPANLATLLR